MRPGSGAAEPPRGVLALFGCPRPSSPSCAASSKRMAGLPRRARGRGSPWCPSWSWTTAALTSWSSLDCRSPPPFGHAGPHPPPVAFIPSSSPRSCSPSSARSSSPPVRQPWTNLPTNAVLPTLPTSARRTRWSTCSLTTQAMCPALPTCPSRRDTSPCSSRPQHGPAEVRPSSSILRAPFVISTRSSCPPPQSPPIALCCTSRVNGAAFCNPSLPPGLNPKCSLRRSRAGAAPHGGLPHDAATPCPTTLHSLSYLCTPTTSSAVRAKPRKEARRDASSGRTSDTRPWRGAERGAESDGEHVIDGEDGERSPIEREMHALRAPASMPFWMRWDLVSGVGDSAACYTPASSAVCVEPCASPSAWPYRSLRLRSMRVHHSHQPRHRTSK